MDITAKIYIALSICLTFTFLLTRPILFHVRKSEELFLSVDLTFFGVELSRFSDGTKAYGADEASDTPDIGLEEIGAITKKIFRFISKCSLTVKKIGIPLSNTLKSGLSYFRFIGVISALLAYADSKTEKLTLENNAMVFTSEGAEFDVVISVMIFDVIVLAAGLLSEAIKIGKMEKSNVRN